MGTIFVLAGVNGAGKSTLGGAVFDETGSGGWFDPDEAARELRDLDPSMDEAAAQVAAWQLGVSLLDRAIAEDLDLVIESTLGGRTITKRLMQAASLGVKVKVWFIGLDDVASHLRRIAARVRAGGHDIPEDLVRERFGSSRRNLISLLPVLSELRVFDNSVEADLEGGSAPSLKLLLEMRGGRVVRLPRPALVPEWAKPILAEALGLGWEV